MPLGMEVCLGPVDYVFDGDPATLTQFWPISIVAQRLAG